MAVRRGLRSPVLQQRVAPASGAGTPARPSSGRRRRPPVPPSVHARGVLATLLFLGGRAAVLLSPGWPTVQATFLYLGGRQGVPRGPRRVRLNVRLFLLGEPLILASARPGGRGVRRSPGLFPVRALAVAYVDLFRGMPSLLVVFVDLPRGAGAAPEGVTTSLFWLGLVSLVLSTPPTSRR